MTFSEAQELIDRRREFVSIVPDAWLGFLLQGDSLQPHSKPFAEGELLCRWWLYRGECPACITDGLQFVDPDLVAFVRDQVLPVRDKANEESVFHNRRATGAEITAAETFFTQRVMAFRKAHGIIPVVDARQEQAFPVPFEIRPDEYVQHSITDSRGNVIEAWEHEAAGLWAVLGKHRVAVTMDLGESASTLRLTGGSFALPVGLAIQHRYESGFAPMEVLATGAVVAGCLKAVEGCEAKGRLARKMGARVWFFPGTWAGQGDSNTRAVSLEEGLLSRAFGRVKEVLAEAGFAELTVPGARNLLNRLRQWSASGGCPLEYAISQTSRCIEVLSQNITRLLETELLNARIHLASLYNHEGRADEAQRILESLRAEMGPGSSQLCKILPNEVVSLCDLGRLDDSEMLGRKAHELASNLEDPAMAVELRIQSAGALGGDALLHKALRLNDSELAKESLGLLEENLELAQELAEHSGGRPYLNEPNWEAMSTARLALWYALFAPEESESRVAKAAERIQQALARHPTRDSSQEYLCRTRFLGAYRQLLRGTLARSAGVNDWALPSEHWVRATALKYRGSIRAAWDEISAAQKDFAAAYELLRLDKTPTVQLIAWSIAAQAVLSLPEGMADLFEERVREDVSCVVEYLSGFGASAGLAGAFAQGGWTRAHLREFQLGFAY